MQFKNAPGMLASCEYTTDNNDPDQSWSLRIFTDYKTGFKAHFPVPSFIMWRVLLTVLPKYAKGKFPIGFSFSTQRNIDEANTGNSAYDQYIWGKADMLGPMPDFAKGIPGK
mmetsp:Transcript_19011/g.41628  ORF Transcript_19011/g.41628 Transcript_19011/m.41628 type:complete len:112 (+) Transcript_19011:1071-1406(+)